jgi:hypothetical protein
MRQTVVLVCFPQGKHTLKSLFYGNLENGLLLVPEWLTPGSWGIGGLYMVEAQLGWKHM